MVALRNVGCFLSVFFGYRETKYSPDDESVDLPEEFAFASGKFVSLIGFKLVPTGLFLPQF